MKVDIEKVEDIIKHFKLEEDMTYLVRVKTASTNVEHKAILFVGFKNGNYCEIYNNTYDSPINLADVYSMKIMKKLVTLK